MDEARRVLRVDLKGGQMVEFVLPKGEFPGYAKSVLYDGLNTLTGETKEQEIENGYTVVSEKTYYAMVEAFQKDACGHWKEITEEEYNDALDILPPLKWYNGGFYMMEAYMGTIHGFYQKYLGKFYTCLEDIRRNRTEIINDLQKFVVGG